MTDPIKQAKHFLKHLPKDITMSNRGTRMISFMQSLKVPEGMLTGSPFTLRDWQQTIIQRVYGPIWKDSCWNKKCVGEDCQKKGKQTCIRMVRKAIYSVSKKNGKTPYIAAINLGHLCGPEAKINEQLYSGAFDRDQASITFRYMRQMVLMDEELSSALNIIESKKEIVSPGNGSIFKALSSEIKGKHGLGPAVLTMDELAQFGADDTFHETLSQGHGAHKEPIEWIISTQAENDLAVLSLEIDAALEAMKPGPKYDPTVVCFLFTTPRKIGAWDEKNWKASNPALGDFLNLADMQEKSRTAQAIPSKENRFRNLRLNQRIGAAAHFITPDLWEGCGAAPEIEEGAEWWGGLDLSGKNDLTALIFVSQSLDTYWNVLPFFWTPKDSLKERETRDKAPYTYWAEAGFLEAKPGKTIDYGWVAQKIGILLSEMLIMAIKFDRWRIHDLKREMDRLGIDCWIEGEDWKEGDNGSMPDGLRLIPHGQGFRDMSPACEVVEDLLRERKLRHGMNPILTWCASNVVIQQDPSGNRKMDKLKSTGRIDGLIGMAMALNGAVSSQIYEPSVYESRGVITL